VQFRFMLDTCDSGRWVTVSGRDFGSWLTVTLVGA